MDSHPCWDIGFSPVYKEEGSVSRYKINRVCVIVPVTLSVLDCVWVLGNVAGGAHGEGIGFKVFWLLIAAQVPFIAGYFATADWSRFGSALGRAVLQFAGLVLAFAPVAYFHL
jgi:hypothetical protein